MKRATHLPFALPDISQAELDGVREVLESGWITTGPKAHLFEREFAGYVGAAHAVAVNSCTAAMHLALDAIGLEAGDFVLTTPYTFAATAEVVRYFDAVPVFVDIEPDTCNIDPVRLAETAADLRHALAAGTSSRNPAVARALNHASRAAGRPGLVRAVIPVHMAGHPCDMDAIAAVAQEHELAVIEDAAHACSASYRGHRIGAPLRSGTPWISCFSFYATKTLATGEGGMVTANDPALVDRIRLMSLHGISRDAWKRYTAEGSWYYEISAPGYKYNMPDILAALGLAQLRRVDEMRRRREDIAARYTDAFGSHLQVETPSVREGVQHAWHLYMLRLRGDHVGDRDQCIARLKDQNIGTSVHFIPLHLHPYYRDTYGYEPTDLPIALREYQREISLPIYSRMTDTDVLSVIDAVSTTLDQFRTDTMYARA